MYAHGVFMVVLLLADLVNQFMLLYSLSVALPTNTCFDDSNFLCGRYISILPYRCTSSNLGMWHVSAI